MEKHHANLVSSYAVEAGLMSEEKINVSENEMRGFLDSVDVCEFREQEPVSVGKDYEILGNGLKGSALYFDGKFVYMTLFAKPDGDISEVRTGFSRRL